MQQWMEFINYLKIFFVFCVLPEKNICYKYIVEFCIVSFHLHFTTFTLNRQASKYFIRKMTLVKDS